MVLPERIRDILEARHADATARDVCATCCSECCTRGGFAILDNVLAIYDLYTQGKLVRAGYRFPPDLSLEAFIFEHFDVRGTTVGPDDDERHLMSFHMKSIDERGRPITIPQLGWYWQLRDELFNANPWLNHGCVFLSHPYPEANQPDGDCTRRCILHTRDFLEVLGPKPIDCIFANCDASGDFQEPSEHEADEWLRTLVEAFPNDRQRCEDLLGPAEPI